MSNIPAELKYVASHEWLRLEEDGTEVGANLAAEEQAGVVESVKAASDVYAPIAGEVVAVNEDLPSAPETANSDPYGAGWFFKIKPANPADYDGLLTAEQYAGEVA